MRSQEEESEKYKTFSASMFKSRFYEEETDLERYKDPVLSENIIIESLKECSPVTDSNKLIMKEGSALETKVGEQDVARGPKLSTTGWGQDK